MTISESIALVLLILVIAAGVAYYVQMGQMSTKEWNFKITQNLLDQQEQQEVAQTEVSTPDTVANDTPVAAKKKKYYPKKPKTHK